MAILQRGTRLGVACFRLGRGIGLLAVAAGMCRAQTADPIRVGVLHSRTGVMARSETPLIGATLMAIEAINQSGGVLGRMLEPVVRDGESSEEGFRRGAIELLEKEHVAVIFGCWTSASRKAVIPELARRDGLLYYPVQYEGEPPSENVVYLGSAPNQQILPAVDWVHATHDPAGGELTAFLVGSDYVFPREANRLVRQRLEHWGGRIVGEEYVPLNKTLRAADFEALVHRISLLHPRFVFNTLNGVNNFSFFAALREADLLYPKTRVISFSIAEPEIRLAGTASTLGQYAAWGYFASSTSGPARAFQQHWDEYAHRSSGAFGGPTSDPMEAAFLAVNLYVDGVRLAGSTRRSDVLLAMDGMVLSAPQGLIRYDGSTRHMWRYVRIGQINDRSDFDTLWESGSAIAPVPVLDARAAPSVTGLASYLPTDESADAAILDLSSKDVSRVCGRLRSLRSGGAGGLAHSPRIVSAVVDVLLRSPWTEQVEAAHLIVSLARAGEPVLRQVLADTATMPPERRLVLAAASADMAERHTPPRRAGASGHPIAGQLVSVLDQGAVLDRVIALRLIAEDEPSPLLRIERSTLARSAASPDAGERLLVAQILPKVAFEASDLESIVKTLVERPPRSFAQQLLEQTAHSLELMARRVPIEALERMMPVLTAAAFQQAIQPPDLQPLQTIIAERRGSELRVPFLARIRSWASENPKTAGLAALGVLYAVALVSVVILWAFAPLAFLSVALVLRRFRIRIPIGQDKKVPMSVSTLLFLPRLKRTMRVLDAWVASSAGRVRADYEALDTVRQRRVHVPLPMNIDQQYVNASNDDTLRGLVKEDRLGTLIVGDGGCGKTHLACRIGDLALERKMFPGRIVLPVLLEPKHQHDVSSVESFDEAVRSVLRGALGGSPRAGAIDDPAFVQSLLRTGRVLVIVDDLHRVAAGSWPIGSRANAAALIATSRTHLQLGELRHRVVSPLRLTADTIDLFVAPYLEIADPSKVLEAKDKQDAAAMLGRLLGLEKTGTKSRRPSAARFSAGVSVMLAKLFCDEWFRRWSAQAGKMDPPSPLELVEQYLARLNNQPIEGMGHADSHAQAYVDPKLLFPAVRRLSWLAVKPEFCPAPMRLVNAEVELQDVVKSEPGSTSRGLLDQIRDNLKLVAYSRVAQDEVVFVDDWLAEHMAAIHLAESPEAWTDAADHLDRLLAAKLLTEKSRDFLRTLSEIMRAEGLPAWPGSRLADRVDAARQELKLDADERVLYIGVLHSETGAMADSESPLIGAVDLAVREINDSQDRVHGYRLKAVVYDGGSDPKVFAQEAERMLREYPVLSIFGCWTSDARKAVDPVVRRWQNLLWYPVQYEGYETSENIIYCGAAPNQQLMPAVQWCVDRFLKSEKRAFFVGSDYIFPWRACEIVRLQLQSNGWICESPEFVDRESENFAAVVARIRKASPTVIFNAVNGRGNMYLFRELKAAGLDAATCPVLSFSIAENEVRAWGIDLFVGHYAAWNYFQSVGGPVNARFVGAYKLLRGDTVTNDPIQTAYVQVHLFKQACLRAKRLRVPDILNAIRQRDSPIRFDAPEGLVQVDPVSQHLWRRVRIGEVQQDGQFKIVHESKDWVEPVPRPYPQLSDTVTRPDPMTR